VPLAAQGYFPNRGLISLVIVMEDGKTVEVGVLGREAFAGVPAVFDDEARTETPGAGESRGIHYRGALAKIVDGLSLRTGAFALANDSEVSLEHADPYVAN
jgi:hypothetical protein